MSKPTLFGRSTPYRRPKLVQHPHKPHKERSDKKHDIRFRVTPHEKMRLKLQAKDHKMSLTSYLSDLLENELPTATNDNYRYETKGSEVGVMICRESFDEVQTLSAKWDMPCRRVCYQIIKDVLERDKNGFVLNDWREK